MKRKKHKTTPERVSGGYEHLPVDADFYTGSPSEQPLFQDKPVSESHRVRKTGRHQAVQGRRKETIDPREKMALLAILKSVIMILLLGIAFFMLWKGIKLYEESVWIEHQGETEISPVLHDVSLTEEFDIENDDARKMFAERIEVWKEAERLVRSADDLLKRDNFDQAIERYQAALRLDPVHMGALERLGTLYYEKGMTVEAINSYIRVLSVDPSRSDLQEELIRALGAHGDAPAVVFMSEWYMEQNYYDEDVQRYLANALYLQEDYVKAAEAYNRVLLDSPKDLPSLEKLAQSHMYLEDYLSALEVLGRLSESNYRDQNYYHQIAICNAQLGNSTETVQTLGKAAHLFGQNIVIGWIQDPRLDPIREDRTFQSFADRVGGEEFRMWLEKVAKTMDGEERKDITPQLKLPENEILQADLHKPRK
ncbi:MAG: tetratricopeptide repeat protein [Pontiella sp.]